MTKFFKKSLNYLYRETILHAIWHFSSYFPLFPTFMVTKGRAFTWKMMGVNIGKNVYIGSRVYLDVPSLKRLTIEDNVLITAETLFLLHKREMKNYCQGVLQNSLPMREGKIIIKKNASIGMRAIILPGVTIGEGAVIGAGSLVANDIPPYTMAVGSPAKVIKLIPKKENVTISK